MVVVAERLRAVVAPVIGIAREAEAEGRGGRQRETARAARVQLTALLTVVERAFPH